MQRLPEGHNTKNYIFFVILFVGGFLFFLAAASSTFYLPLAFDSAHYLWYGKNIADGKVLYRDVWDVPQPGVFWMSYFAGSLFGFEMTAPKKLEILWMGLMFLFAALAFRRRFHFPWIALVIPLAILIPYYAFGSPPRLMHRESWMWLPLLVCCWCLMEGALSSPTRRLALWFLAAGVFAGVATSFKHLYGVVPTAMFVFATFWHWRTTQTGIRGLMPLVGLACLPFAIGVIAVWALIVGIFAIQGGLAAFFEANFLFALTYFSDTPDAPFVKLAVMFTSGGLILSPIIIVACLCLIPAGDAGRQQGAADGGFSQSPTQPLVGLAVVWLVGIIIVIALQRHAWWGYYSLGFYPPVAILAACGLDRLVRAAKQGGLNSELWSMTGAATVMLVMFATYSYPVAREINERIQFMKAHQGSIDAYREHSFPEYAEALEAANHIKERGYSGPVYVFGHSHIYLLSGTEQAFPPHGLGPGIMTPRLWQTVEESIKATPPEFIFIAERWTPFMRKRGTALTAYLESAYTVDAELQSGTWYRYQGP